MLQSLFRKYSEQGEKKLSTIVHPALVETFPGKGVGKLDMFNE